MSGRRRRDAILEAAEEAGKWKVEGGRWKVEGGRLSIVQYGMGL
jgi:hypothetical protein